MQMVVIGPKLPIRDVCSVGCYREEKQTFHGYAQIDATPLGHRAASRVALANLFSATIKALV